MILKVFCREQTYKYKMDGQKKRCAFAHLEFYYSIIFKTSPVFKSHFAFTRFVTKAL